MPEHDDRNQSPFGRGWSGPAIGLAAGALVGAASGLQMTTAQAYRSYGMDHLALTTILQQILTAFGRPREMGSAEEALLDQMRGAIEGRGDAGLNDPESAKRVQHPAPFPVALPRRLIEMYTFEGDLVLDPFMGAGSTAVAAVQAGRRFVGYDTDEAYLDTARARIAEASPLQ